MKTAIFAFTWNDEDLGEAWFNIDNLRHLLFSGAATREELLQVEEYELDMVKAAPESRTASEEEAMSDPELDCCSCDWQGDADSAEWAPEDDGIWPLCPECGGRCDEIGPTIVFDVPEELLDPAPDFATQETAKALADFLAENAKSIGPASSGKPQRKENP